MTVQALLEAAKKEGDLAAMSWYASDHSDGAEPNGRSRIIVTDATWSAKLIEAGEARAVDGGAELDIKWEFRGEVSAISFAQHWSRAFVKHLEAQGVAAHSVDDVEQKLDTASLERGLKALSDGMECISVETYHHSQKLWVTRKGKGPFVLQLIRGLRELPTADTYLAAARGRSLEVRDGDDGAMVALGSDRKAVVAELLRALEALLATPPTTVVARYAPVTTLSW